MTKLVPARIRRPPTTNLTLKIILFSCNFYFIYFILYLSFFLFRIPLSLSLLCLAVLLSSIFSFFLLFCFAAGVMGLVPENRILIGDYMVASTTPSTV